MRHSLVARHGICTRAGSCASSEEKVAAWWARLVFKVCWSVAGRFARRSFPILKPEPLFRILKPTSKRARMSFGLENFWALLKRGLSGTYVSVEPFHLFRYIDEHAFRYNNRLPN